MQLGEDLQKEHVPSGLAFQERYPTLSDPDERGFRLHAPKLSEYEDKLAEQRVGIGNDSIFREGLGRDTRRVLPDMVKALGRVPSPAELMRETQRQKMVFNQPLNDTWYDPASYKEAEVYPQRQVIESRALDFPADPAEWESAPAELREVEVSTRAGVSKIEKQLIITTGNQRGGKTEHPVMTTAELQWVKDSADVIADHAKGGKVFIGGLGFGLLNKELDQRGVSHQVVAEINTNVIGLITPDLKKSMRGNLELRQGDFRQKLQEAVDSGEQFDAISIDAFPNTADEVNRDASGKEVIKLALRALRPGGVLTFYPDSRYLPMRVLQTLDEEGIPKSCIHYTVSKFEQSDFTEQYHYGNLMAVPCIMKPLVSDQNTVSWLTGEYMRNEQPYLDLYSENYSKKNREVA